MRKKIDIEQASRLRETGLTHREIAEIMGVHPASMRRALAWIYVTKTCERCGASFEATKGNARYCSASCKVIAFRIRKANNAAGT